MSKYIIFLSAVAFLSGCDKSSPGTDTDTTSGGSTDTEEPGDSGEPGDTEEPGDTGDTDPDPVDTGELGETGEPGDTDEPGDTAPPETTWVEAEADNNASGCLSTNTVYPLSGEEGHLAAGRLTPPAWPFIVESVRYNLSTRTSSVSCDAGLEHRVDLFVEAGTTPSASPTVAASYTVPASETEDGSHELELVLDTPIELAEGEHLYVGIEMTGEYPDGVLCLDTCTDDTTSEANWWSNAAETPYDWAELSSWGISGDYRIVAAGLVPEGSVEVDCGDGLDEDGDGATDCEDSDCDGVAECLSCPDDDLGGDLGEAVVVDTLKGAGDDLAGSCALAGGSELAYTWTAPADGLYRFDTVGSDTDTVIYVLSECGGEELACNDDEGGTLQSSVEVDLVSGETVLIAVGGFYTTTGAYVLNIN
jgi:hypothetical protein